MGSTVPRPGKEGEEGDHSPHEAAKKWALAYLDGHPFVSPDHVQEAAGAVLVHRLITGSGERAAAADLVAALLAEVPVPLGVRG